MKKMNWQQEFFTNFTSSESASVQPVFPQSTHYNNKTSSHTLNARTQRSFVDSFTRIDEVREEYRQRNVNDIQREKGVPGCKISSFVSPWQDNVEEAGVQDTKEGASCGFCSEQYNCRKSSPFRHCIQCTQCAVKVPFEVHWH